MPNNLYEIRNLRVSYPDMANKPLFGYAPRIDIIKGVSFDVREGEILGIVGGSGSGKSTLGRAMLRLLDSDSGNIQYNGEDITHWPEIALRTLRQQFQMIFQDPMSSLNPRHKVSTIIGGPLKLHGFEQVEKRVENVLEMVGLPTSFKFRYPHELSGGQRQRVGIARAIALEPKFVLADEILSGLDVSSQAQVLALLERLREELNFTMAFVSHDLSVVRRLCDRTMVLKYGKIIELADSASLFSSPQTAYTKELLDAIPLPEIKPDWLEKRA
ncbi:ABC transporter ATP-binding protein [Vibrio penaeicida]|uniref:Dipeptide/oligopeptide/nickel ABC transporter ATP-binding protein n=1 Tax=Vibrio penaeicida TaxID=104609 RepID=A0AAV5NUC8_9VIBR|nr:ABC transporter ATP-binding protein [Vibrio penaeicida]RTZ21202.1 ABC transporter ATP-binding protein [Vibrio penaeicida]GLQ74045.1 dipeptide/oligopeptide/nickel ABC transporter ATP-binding protein [Vibrio penaeicida]